MELLIGELSWVPWVYFIASALVVIGVLGYAIWGGKRYGPPSAPEESEELYKNVMDEARADKAAAEEQRKTDMSAKSPDATAPAGGRES